MKHVNQGNKSRLLLNLNILFPLPVAHGSIWINQNVESESKKVWLCRSLWLFKIYLGIVPYSKAWVFQGLWNILWKSSKWKRFLYLFYQKWSWNKFENAKFRSFCEKNSIFYNFYSTRTPQKNGVFERKNRTLQEMARTMLYENSLPKHF